MRVGWVVDGSLDQLSGGYLYDRRIVDHLRRHEVEVVVLSLPTGSYGSRLARGIGDTAHQLVVDAAPDVLVEDELSHPGLIRVNRQLARSGAAPIRVGLVHHLRSSEPRGFLANACYRQVERMYLSTLQAFIVNSRATRAAVGRLHAGRLPSLVAVPGADRLPVSLDPADIEARAQQPGPLRILFVGNLIPRKGLLSLIEAVALLPPGSVALNVVGSPAVDPGYARRVLARVAHLALDAVRFLGPLEGDALSRLMLAHQVLAVPSSYEGYGMALLEGMGRGLPAIGGSAGGSAEFVRHGDNGYLVRPDDSSQLAVHLADLHYDRQRLAQMALAAHRTYLAHPTWETTGEAIRRFLERLHAAPSPIDADQGIAPVLS